MPERGTLKSPHFLPPEGLVQTNIGLFVGRRDERKCDLAGKLDLT